MIAFFNSEFSNWFVQLISTTSILSVGAIIFRGPIANFFSKSLDSHFERKLEKFRSEIRSSETELNEIRSFLVSAQRERDIALNAKKREAAEFLLKRRQHLEKFMMLVEYLRILKVDEIMKRGDDNKTIEFIKVLSHPFNLDERMKEINDYELSFPSLYLSEKTINNYSAFESIIVSAIMTMKLLSLEIKNKEGMLNTSNLSQKIIELIPSSKEHFEKNGDSFAYYFDKHFYDETLKLLRHEVAGTDDLTRDSKSIERAAIDTRQAQMNIQASLKEAGLPTSLIK